MAARVHTIEFQKSSFLLGLPCMHSFIFFERNHKFSDADDVDKLMCAEFLDQVTDPLLFDTILSSMVHGPCGLGRNPNASYLVSWVCSKEYPKSF